MPKAAELVIPKWTTSNGFTNFDTNRRVVNDRLEIDSLGTYPAVTSAIRYDMVSSHFGVHLVSTPNISNGSTEVLMSVEFNPSNMVSIGWGGTNIYARKVVAGVTTDTYVAYNATQHKYLRIREAAGQVYWEASPTGTTWTNLKTPEATPFDMSSVIFILLSGNWNSAPTPGMATFGAVNAYDSATTPTTPTNAPNPTNLHKAPQQVGMLVAANPELAPLDAQPTAKWINNQADADAIPSLVTAAAGKTLVLCVYAIPNRDGGGGNGVNYSAGGFPDRASYLAFINSIKTNLGSAPAFISYEPDALGLAGGTNFTTEARAERIETLKQAVAILGTIPNAETYIDASMWHAPATTQRDLLLSVDISKIAGVTLNTSAYNNQALCYSYGNDVVAALASAGVPGKKFIIDTSRNGSGELTEADRPLASPWLDNGMTWCNPPKRTIGLNPGTPATGQPNLRANLWIKTPGESDGTFPSMAQSTYFGENAPTAGTFWIAQARDLLGLSPQKGTTTPTEPTVSGTISDVTADFETTFGLFTQSYGGVSLVNSRLRIPLTPDYPAASTPYSYKLTGGSIVVQMSMPTGVAAAADAEAASYLIVTSSTSGVRVIVCLFPKTNTARFHVQGNPAYWDDGAGADVTYDAATMAWIRIRESAGQVYIETSPNGTNTWTIRRQKATPAWAADSTNSVMLQAYASVAGGYTEFDSVNLKAVIKNVFRLENGVWIATNIYKKFFA